MLSKTDYTIAAFIGFLSGIFILPVLFNLGFRDRLIFFILPLAIPPLFALGMWFSGLLSHRLPFMAQFGKFAAVGFLNTAIDFGVLNLLSAAIGVTAGFIIGGVNVPGFGIAVFNSYFWNKLWVFSDREKENIFHDFPKFLAVTFIGLIINSVIVILLTTYLVPFAALSGRIWRYVWLNISKAAATVISLVWNFTGYKFFVFRK